MVPIPELGLFGVLLFCPTLFFALLVGWIFDSAPPRSFVPALVLLGTALSEPTGEPGLEIFSGTSPPLHVQIRAWVLLHEQPQELLMETAIKLTMFGGTRCCNTSPSTGCWRLSPWEPTFHSDFFSNPSLQPGSWFWALPCFSFAGHRPRLSSARVLSFLIL